MKKKIRMNRVWKCFKRRIWANISFWRIGTFGHQIWMTKILSKIIVKSHTNQKETICSMLSTKLKMSIFVFRNNKKDFEKDVNYKKANTQVISLVPKYSIYLFRQLRIILLMCMWKTVYKREVFTIYCLRVRIGLLNDTVNLEMHLKNWKLQELNCDLWKDTLAAQCRDFYFRIRV